MDIIAVREGVHQSNLMLFYYEFHEQEFDEIAKIWLDIEPEPLFFTQVEKPTNARLAGYDVVSFSTGQGPGCSPLSCNSLAVKIPVNEECLFATFEDAKGALEAGKFDNSEPGPFRIVAVYLVGN
jgi:hypothetical protein